MTIHPHCLASWELMIRLPYEVTFYRSPFSSTFQRGVPNILHSFVTLAFLSWGTGNISIRCTVASVNVKEDD